VARQRLHFAREVIAPGEACQESRPAMRKIADHGRAETPKVLARLPLTDEPSIVVDARWPLEPLTGCVWLDERRHQHCVATGTAIYRV
jgi:hypothetical protein